MHAFKPHVFTQQGLWQIGKVKISQSQITRCAALGTIRVVNKAEFVIPAENKFESD